MDEAAQQDHHDRTLLAQHRANLRHLERQAAGYGSERQAPVHVMNQIRDARKDIADLKQRMRVRGTSVAEDPGVVRGVHGRTTARSRSEAKFLRMRLGGMVGWPCAPRS